MTDCIKRAGTYWTTCACADCTQLRARRRKLHYVGHTWRIPQHIAWDTLAAKFDAGWTARAVGSATHLDPPGTTNGRLYFSRHLTAWKRGDTVLLGPTVAHAIMTMGVPTEGQVSAEPSRRRLRALATIGHGLNTLEAETGVAFSTLAMIRNTNTRVSARNAIDIAETYARLHMTPGGDEQAARIAREKGWPSPLMWDDIDADPSPAATGETWGQSSVDHAVVLRVLRGERKPRKLTNAEAAEVVRRAVASGMSTTRIEDDLGLKPERYLRIGGAA